MQKVIMATDNMYVFPPEVIKKNIGRAISVSIKIYHWIFIFSISIARFINVNTRNSNPFFAIDCICFVYIIGKAYYNFLDNLGVFTQIA